MKKLMMGLMAFFLVGCKATEPEGDLIWCHQKNDVNTFWLFEPIDTVSASGRESYYLVTRRNTPLWKKRNWTQALYRADVHNEHFGLGVGGKTWEQMKKEKPEDADKMDAIQKYLKSGETPFGGMFLSIYDPEEVSKPGNTIPRFFAIFNERKMVGHFAYLHPDKKKLSVIPYGVYERYEKDMSKKMNSWKEKNPDATDNEEFDVVAKNYMELWKLSTRFSQFQCKNVTLDYMKENHMFVKEG